MYVCMCVCIFVRMHTAWYREVSCISKDHDLDLDVVRVDFHLQQPLVVVVPFVIQALVVLVIISLFVTYVYMYICL